MDPPLLMVDIDGVVSLFGFDHQQPPAGTYVGVDGIPHFLSRPAAEHLLRLESEFELVWCSGWEEKADEHLPYTLGLPAGLPHLRFAAAGPGTNLDGRHWKLAAIDRFAGPERPLAWIDDAHDETCHRWASDRAGPTLLVATDPAVGLTAAHAERLIGWARSLPASGAPSPPDA